MISRQQVDIDKKSTKLIVQNNRFQNLYLDKKKAICIIKIFNLPTYKSSGRVEKYTIWVTTIRYGQDRIQ